MLHNIQPAPEEPIEMLNFSQKEMLPAYLSDQEE